MADHRGWKHPAEFAVADALDKARYFVLGCTNLVIAVDNKLLLKIFGIEMFDFVTLFSLSFHIPGVKSKASDDTLMVTLPHPRCSCWMMTSLPSLISYSPMIF